MKESFGPKKENNSLKGPLLNHLTSEKTKHNFSYILMLWSWCSGPVASVWDLSPLSGNLPPPPPAQKTYHPLPNYKCHLNKTTLKISRLIDVSLITSTNLPISMKPPWSLSALSLVVRPTVAHPCLNKGTLLLLRSSFLFCLAGTMPYTLNIVLTKYQNTTIWRGQGRWSLLSPCECGGGGDNDNEDGSFIFHGGKSINNVYEIYIATDSHTSVSFRDTEVNAKRVS